jgi:hypothetical protein
MEDWKAKLLKQRSNNNDAIAQAHIDAGDYGCGWLRVDHYGNLERIDPEDILIAHRHEDDAK